MPISVEVTNHNRRMANKSVRPLQALQAIIHCVYLCSFIVYVSVIPEYTLVYI